jgi:hypothetical protein
VARGDERFAPGTAHEPVEDALPVGAPGRVTEVLDGAVRLLRNRMGTVLGIAAALFLPVQAVGLAVAVTRRTPLADDIGGVQGLAALGDGSGWGWVLVALQALALSAVGVAMGVVAAGALDGARVGAASALRVLARRWWVVPPIVVLSAVMKVPAACFAGFGWIFVDALLLPWSVVAGAEGLGPIASLRRTLQLTRPGYGLAFGVAVGGLFITWVAQLVLVAGPVVLLSSLSLPQGWVLAVEQVTSLLVLVTASFTASVAVRLYVDLRCRVEGLDLVRRSVGRGLVRR